MPYIVRQCVEEIERRGMEEVGIYRVSGVATDIQALKAAFDVSECRAGQCGMVVWAQCPSRDPGVPVYVTTRRKWHCGRRFCTSQFLTRPDHTGVALAELDQGLPWGRPHLAPGLRLLAPSREWKRGANQSPGVSASGCREAGGTAPMAR